VGPVKNRRGSFVKVVNENFPLFFTGQTTSLTKHPSYRVEEAQNGRKNLNQKLEGT